VTLITPERDIRPRAVVFGPNAVLTENQPASPAAQPAFQAAHPGVPRTSPCSTAKTKPITVRESAPQRLAPISLITETFPRDQGPRTMQPPPNPHHTPHRGVQEVQPQTAPPAQQCPSMHMSTKRTPYIKKGTPSRASQLGSEDDQSPPGAASSARRHPTPAMTVPRASTMQGPLAARCPGEDTAKWKP
jgi:hypothetical protein